MDNSPPDKVISETKIQAISADRPFPVLWGTIGVIEYEIRRAITPFRIGVWLALMAFPIFLVSSVSYLVNHTSINSEENQIGFTFMLFILLPEVITVLAMLLWATPIVNAELESHTWVYSVVRPGARWSMLLGKYTVAVLWTFSCTAVAATICVPITQMTDAWNAWFIICALSLLSAMAHGALFLLIGSLFQKRAMVIAFAYAITVEAVLGWVPAMINKVTIAYRLRSITFQWMDLELGRILESNDFVSSGVSIAEHVAILLLGTAILLSLALWRIQRSQYSWQSELT